MFKCTCKCVCNSAQEIVQKIFLVMIYNKYTLHFSHSILFKESVIVNTFPYI